MNNVMLRVQIILNMILLVMLYTYTLFEEVPPLKVNDQKLDTTTTIATTTTTTTTI